MAPRDEAAELLKPKMLFFIVLIFFLSTFVQSIIGFGSALIAMPLLVSMLGIQIAAPMVAVAALLTEVAILLRYREAFNFAVVKYLALATILGIPVGVYAVRYIDSDVVNKILGIIVIGYALYALLAPKLPDLAGMAWTFVFGFLAGILGGAYNTSGPPYVIYGNAQSWSPNEFKSNLQGLFLVNGIIIVAVHAMSGNLSSDVFRYLLYGLPGLVLGLVAGFLLSKRINPQLFRNTILIALLFLGASLLIL
jgi:uncharacterized membrane protein YfcA